MTHSSWPQKALDGLFCWGLFLPMTMTHDHKSRSVRLMGLLWFAVWILPALAVSMMPFVLLIFAEAIVMAWRGYEA